ncbi:MAG: hypothetical protein CVT90_00975 [Candidatus Altiarchaeales archaeon HGW-Altiarchaeales-3]|nr:MAG: hypothetical protein CVT90_00975 [Candidatus Altiarchaeales archaeon HGW-Altiarchaeales-3]
MKKKFNNVYQFKITLNGTNPPVWRRIMVPETYSFWDLHVAIQDAMGWEDYHKHIFIIKSSTRRKKYIGTPDEDYFYDCKIKVLPGWEQKIQDYFSMENKSAEYLYDFNSNWEHEVMLEKILHMDTDVNYPVCIEGKRACPPEECGGIYFYRDFLEGLNDPEHEEHEAIMRWIGREFDPEDFEPGKVCFEDPGERMKIALNIYLK